MDNKANHSKREDLQLKEWQHNPSGNLNDGIKKADGNLPADLSTKFIGILIVIILLFSIIFWMMFK